MGADNIVSLNLKNTSLNPNIKKYNVKNSTLNLDLTKIDYEFQNIDYSTSKEVIQEDYNKNTMVNDSGVFSEFTDYQNVMFFNLINLQDKNLNKYLGVEGKTIEQLYSEIEDESLKKALESLKKNGFEKIKIIEVVEGKNGFDAIVLQDVNGDYNIFYPCTNVNEFDDILYDTYNVIKYIIDQGNLDKKAIKEIEQLANIFLGKDIDYLEDIYDLQQNSAHDLAKKYFDIASKESVELNFSGYSLGGSLAEESYLYLYKKYESKVDTLGGLKLYNPYHDNLSKKEVKTLKNSDSFELYCAEGDMVSAMFNFDDFKDEANYIYVDYTSLIEEDLKSKDISSFNLPDWTNFLLESEIVGVNQNDLKNLNNIINNFSLISSCFHSIEAFEAKAAVAFYNDGSLREMIGNHEVVGVSFSDVSKNIFGCDVVDYIIDTIKNIFDSHIGDVFIDNGLPAFNKLYDDMKKIENGNFFEKWKSLIDLAFSTPFYRSGLVNSSLGYLKSWVGYNMSSFGQNTIASGSEDIEQGNWLFNEK